MSSSIIQVTNLSKSYTISHEGRERYTALRDVMAQKAKKIFSFPSFLRGGTTKQSPYKEEFWALKDVSFNIEQGDRVGIIGRNGAGKSTLLKILSRITEPTTGSIKIKGRVASLLEVGTGFHPELTGRENIFLNGAILGMSRVEIKKHFDAIVDFAEVEKFLDTPVKRYSSGMYVRLAFAVAAHLEPEILVVDEVLAVGDAKFQKKCLGKMEEVSKGEGRTVLFVSHNMTAVQALCNKGIVLVNGKTQFDGNISMAIQEYNSSYNNLKPSVYIGNGIIKKVHVVGAENNLIKYNTDIKIEVLFSSKNSIKNLVLGIVIRDEFDVPIIGVNNRHYLNKSLHLNEIYNGIIEIKISPLMLLPSTYKMDVYLGDSTIDLEEIKEALCFEVEVAKINPTAFQLNASINKLFIKNIDWNIKDV